MSSRTKKPVKKFKSIGQIQKIEWDDHFSTNGRWLQPEEIKTIPLTNVSVGKVIYEDNRVVTLAGTWGDEIGNVCDPITIIKGCITHRKIMK